MTYTPHQPVHTAGTAPLSAPLYGATLPEAVSRFFKKYATFTGRASRSEYWWWTLVSAVVSIVLNLIISAGASSGTNSSPGPITVVAVVLAGIWFLAVIVPSLALLVRRLHDVNVSGWMVLIGLVPFIGSLVLLVLTLMGPKSEGQRFDAHGQ
ncbi:DUF805 domain-containing protein [Paeniglutamicibacter antarcticus]|uniref:DUF805 domain-containing protein n=1 Tax=Arthrobacter terrae TaxID=2935737 RepID=A0A931CHX2_9MICC|nr:DUF805 domain-containing protein [Arthrobacter terrae]MBG0738907.1 DUF805 domain-containing protein [Arthrobacter terrae]